MDLARKKQISQRISREELSRKIDQANDLLQWLINHEFIDDDISSMYLDPLHEELRRFLSDGTEILTMIDEANLVAWQLRNGVGGQ